MPDTVVIVGVGALGSHLALLARNWELQLPLVDFDRVEQKNVQGQFHTRMGLGRNKAQAFPTKTSARQLPLHGSGDDPPWPGYVAVGQDDSTGGIVHGASDSKQPDPPPDIAVDTIQADNAIVASKIETFTISLPSRQDERPRRIHTREQAEDLQKSTAHSLNMDPHIYISEIRFQLIPPGITGSDIENESHFFIAETPISELDWSRFLSGQGAEGDPTRVQTFLSLADAKNFLDYLSQRLQEKDRELTRDLVADFPTINELQFCASWVRDDEIPRPKAGLALRTAKVSPFGLYDLVGNVSQYCECENLQCRHRIWDGKSYCIAVRGHVGSKLTAKCISSSISNDTASGFRPVLRQRQFLYL